MNSLHVIKMKFVHKWGWLLSHIIHGRLNTLFFFHNYSLSHLHEYEIKCHMLGIFGINHVTRIKL